jgi:hypothetical protein
MQKMIHHKSTLTSEIGEQEVALIEKRSMYGQHESIVLNRRENLASLQISIQALETKVLTDKRVQYELDKLKTEENDQNAALEKLESNEAMANLRHEIKGRYSYFFKNCFVGKDSLFLYLFSLTCNVCYCHSSRRNYFC